MISNESIMKKRKIIPIAGGKGGIGKSVVSANLAISLAQLGHKTVAIDLDLGGANLYMLLGLNNENPGIGEFLNSADLELSDLMIQTEWPSLKFIPGDGQTPFLANISFTQKQKLIKSIRNIEAEYIILDLGAGTSFNVLDFFGITRRGLIVTSLERVALMNTLVFIKNFLLRTIDRALVRRHAAQDLIRNYYTQSLSSEQKTIALLLEQLTPVDEEAAKIIQDLCERCRPWIVYNMVGNSDTRKIHNSILSSTKKNLSLKVDHLGIVHGDHSVTKSIQKGIPLMKYNADGTAVRGIFTVAGELTQAR